MKQTSSYLPTIVASSVGILFLTVSVIGVTLTYTSYKKTEALSQEVTQTTVVPTEEILGVSKEVCASKQEYKDRLIRYRPYITTRFETEQTEISAITLLSCATVVPVANTNNPKTCEKFETKIDTTCLSKSLREKPLFQQPKEAVSGVNRTVTLRVSDEVVDYDALAELVSKEYIKNSSFDTVVGGYAIRKTPFIAASGIATEPNTDGTVAQRYIEVDGSRQVMFVWESGKYKKYRMSGAFPEYNPVGVFTILNKSPLAWSSTANKWMPYWMAFTYDKKQAAMLGIHALIYWYPGFQKTGETKIYEPESNIGKPRSTGCLRLTVSEAEKVYNWAKVGDVVVVHD